VVSFGNVGWEEGEARGIGAGLGKLNATGRAEERVRYLGEDACAIAGIRVGASRSPVLKVAQDAQCAGHDVVSAPCREVRYEAHHTGVVLEPAVVKSVRHGRHHQSPVVSDPLNSCANSGTTLALLRYT
jgi:hypothetical protein